MTNTKVVDLHETATVPPPIVNKSDQVRSVFENVPRYVNGRPVDIRIRQETVRKFVAPIQWKRLLDLGCGNGAISLPLLTHASHLTLLDLSASMLATAQARVPNSLTGNVEIRNENFMVAPFDPGSFDLVVCVGVLAHVDSPDEFVAKIAGVLRPGGSLILGFTDSRHMVGRLARFMGRLKEILAPARYPVNLLSYSDVAQIVDRQKMKMVSSFRYAEIPIPGIERALPPGILYRIVRLIFGRSGNHRNAWLGNEYICLLTKN